MRKSSVLLTVSSLACALSAVGSWWQLREERERVAALELQLAELQTRGSRAPVVASNHAEAHTASPAIPTAVAPTNKSQQEQAKAP
jgi:hypothetical protein